MRTKFSASDYDKWLPSYKSIYFQKQACKTLGDYRLPFKIINPSFCIRMK